MSNRLNLIGKIYSRLTVIEDSGNDAYNRSKWKCICQCGKIKIINSYDLQTGDTQSCGCYRKEITKLRSIKHGEALKTVEYKAWAGMLQRCTNKNNQDYYSYGGRGIKVCKRGLNSYKNFLIDMGRKPNKEYSLDRINNNGNYEPSNCRWATYSEQNLNRRKFKRNCYATPR